MKLTKAELKTLRDCCTVVQDVYQAALEREFPVGLRLRHANADDDDMENCFRVVGHEARRNVSLDQEGKIYPNGHIGNVLIRMLDKTGTRVYGGVIVSRCDAVWTNFKRMDPSGR